MHTSSFKVTYFSIVVSRLKKLNTILCNNVFNSVMMEVSDSNLE